jgi:menaquinone-dependent protoporphyrinogen oxidase
MTKVLILFGTRFGSTQEVCERIADILEDKGIQTLMLNLEDSTSRDAANLEEFDGLMVASGIRAGKMTKETRNFIEANSDYLKAMNMPLGFFVSSGMATTPEKIAKFREEYIEDYLDQYNIEPDLYDVFGGVIDLSADSNLGFFAKKMVKEISEQDPKIKPNQKNDLRDWEQIRAFAEKYAKLFQ